VLFTDESSLEVGATDRQIRISRQSGEAYLPKNMLSTFRSSINQQNVQPQDSALFSSLLHQVGWKQVHESVQKALMLKDMQI
ncbi:hypothetical protein IE53DRAFT_308236, partial [Violaceomyces palustris]